MRKEKNTIRIKEKKKRKLNKMKKILIIITALTLSACSSIGEKAGKLKPNVGKCPPQAERTLADILCQEPK